MAAGYSGTPLARKLGIRPGSVVALAAVPPDWAIDGLPDGVVVRRSLWGRPDIVVAFARSLQDLKGRAVAATSKRRMVGWAQWCPARIAMPS